MTNKSEAKFHPNGNFYKQLGTELNLGNVFDESDIIAAIRNLKHSLILSQQEVKIYQDKIN